MKIATWNVSGIRRGSTGRGPGQGCLPDIALQKTKCVDDAFPRLSSRELGYNIAVLGQKGFMAWRPVEAPVR
jgi:exodeoxyribonuclease-3